MASTLQPPAERIILKGHKPLSHTTLLGWPALLFGAVFVIMGSPILANGMNWMDYPQSSIHAPLWVIEICGGLFVACGVWLMVHGANGLRRWWNMANGKQ
jgi:threonine/homoserine/homoserine lactone efflux protein